MTTANVIIKGRGRKILSFSLDIWNKWTIFAKCIPTQQGRQHTTGRNTYSLLHPDGGTQTEYTVELKRNLRNRNIQNLQLNGDTKPSLRFLSKNTELEHINNIELLALVLVPKNIAKFQRQSTSILEVHTNRAWAVLCLSVVWSLGGNL